MTALEAAILAAVQRTRLERDYPANILAAIGETHCVIERERWERVVAFSNDRMVVLSLGRARTLDRTHQTMREYGLQPANLDPIRHDAAGSDTPEGEG